MIPPPTDTEPDECVGRHGHASGTDRRQHNDQRRPHDPPRQPPTPPNHRRNHDCRGHQPFREASWRLARERDVAVVAAALLEPGHVGRAYDLNGPQMVTRRARVEAIAAAVGRPVPLEVVTPARAREIYLNQGGFAADNADFVLGFGDYSGNVADLFAFDEFDPGPASLPPTAGQVTGCSARTF